MVHEELLNTIEELAQPGRGILAADESMGTIGKRFDGIGLENTEEHRRQYRSLLASTEGLGEYVDGMILFEESLEQKTDSGVLIPEALAAQNIIPGVKVDKGLIRLANTEIEQITQGLDGLSDRLERYKKLGARFAKWRNVYTISGNTPGITAIKAGAEVLARYAAVCQEYGIVPIVEPEILINGNHSIEQCAEASEIVLNELFQALFYHQVECECIILKPSMVLPGQDCADQSSPDEIAEFTLSVFRNNVPACVPTINFLSGGQTPEQATQNLQAINSFGKQAWALSFSYGRALQEPCLAAWQGKAENLADAQQALLHRAKCNAMASVGEYEA